MDPYVEIANKFNELSKSHRKVAEYILNNPTVLPFYTVEKLAKEVGVSDATVVRFAVTMGYKGYPDFQYHIQQQLQKKLTTTERLKRNQLKGNTTEELIKKYLTEDIKSIQQIIKDIDIAVFEQTIEKLLNANRIYIISSRSAGAPGMFLYYYLDMLLGNVTLVEDLEKHGEKLLHLNQDDVAVSISSVRYTRNTVELFKYASEQNATSIAITDSLTSPLVPYADLVLYTRNEFPSFFESFVSTLSLINLILAFIGKHKEADNTKRLEDLEDLWAKLKVFY